MSATEKEQAKASLKKKISDFIADTATLDVLTLTGEIALTIKKDAAGQPTDALDWDDMFKNIAKQLEPSATDTKVSVLAYTHAEWDQDSVNYVKEGANSDLLKAHNDSVKSAHEARLNAIKSVAEAVDQLF